VTPRANAFVLTPFFLEKQRLRLLRLARKGWHVNQPSVSGKGQLKRMTAIHAPLAAFVAESVKRGTRPVSIAGDCCAAIPVLAGLVRVGLAPVIVWLDAHGDFNTPDTTVTGFTGGMPLAMIAGRGDLTLTEAAGLAPTDERDVVLCDGRNLDPAERAALEQSKVTLVTDLARLLDYVPKDRPVFVHFDPDIIDAADAPAQQFPESGGPSLARVCEVLGKLGAERDVRAVSLAAWDLAKDRRRTTEQAAFAALDALLGSGGGA
jgi:arginase